MLARPLLYVSIAGVAAERLTPDQQAARMAVINEHGGNIQREPPGEANTSGVSSDVASRVTDLVNTMLDPAKDNSTRLEAVKGLLGVGKEEGALALRPAIPGLLNATNSKDACFGQAVSEDGMLPCCVDAEAAQALAYAGFRGVEALGRAVADRSRTGRTRALAADGLLSVGKQEKGEMMLQRAVTALTLALQATEEDEEDQQEIAVQLKASRALAKAGLPGLQALNATMLNRSNTISCRKKAVGAIHTLIEDAEKCGDDTDFSEEWSEKAQRLVTVAPGFAQIMVEDSDPTKHYDILDLQHSTAQTLNRLVEMTYDTSGIRQLAPKFAAALFKVSERKDGMAEYVAGDLGSVLSLLDTSGGPAALHALQTAEAAFSSKAATRNKLWEYRDGLQNVLESKCAKAAGTSSQCCVCSGSGSGSWSASGSCSHCHGNVERRVPVTKGCSANDKETFKGGEECVADCLRVLREPVEFRTDKAEVPVDPHLKDSMVAAAQQGLGRCTSTLAEVLANAGAAAGPSGFRSLRRAELSLLKTPDLWKTGAFNNAGHAVRLSRKQVWKALENHCAKTFRRQAGAEAKVQYYAVSVPHGVALLAHENGTDAHYCPNRFACSGDRASVLTANGAPNSTMSDECPLLIDHKNKSGKASPMCAEGYDPRSPGCSRCLSKYGSRGNDPFTCSGCVSGMRWWAVVRWLAQPLGIFCILFHSAEMAAARDSSFIANDVVKILTAWFASVGLVISTVTTSSAFQELGAEDKARRMLGYTGRMAQAGDVTYTSSPDCVLHSGDRAATIDERLLLSLVLPVAILAIGAILLTIRACIRAALSQGTMGMKEIWEDVKDGMLTSSLVAGNQFLPSVAASCMRAIPCFHTQKDVKGEPLIQFMAYSPDQECHAQKWYVLTCGPVLALAFLLGPVYWQTLIRRKRSDEVGPVRFLTGAYRDGYSHWESLRLSKTILIACVDAVSPASYCPGQQLALGLLVNGVFALMHSYNRPYNNRTLNLAEAASLGVLCASMVLAGLLGGGSWSMTNFFRHELIIVVSILVFANFLCLAILWVRIKFFWVYLTLHGNSNAAQSANRGKEEESGDDEESETALQQQTAAADEHREETSEQMEETRPAATQ